MVLTIDIGNTTIGIGIFSENILCSYEKISSTEVLTHSAYIKKLKNIFETQGLSVASLEGSIISSVVPGITPIFQRALDEWSEKPVLVLSHEMKLGIEMKVERPEKVGCDRIADAVAAAMEYSLPLITIDMGTATTINVVDEQHNFRGGIIMPGVGTANQALLGKTAQLSGGDMDMPTHTIGINTEECITSGMIYGNACASDGLIARINEELGSACTVIATGGYAKTVIPYCKTNIILDEHLLMKGLKILFHINK